MLPTSKNIPRYFINTPPKKNYLLTCSHPQTDLPDGKNLGFPIDQVIAVMAKPFSEQNIAATALLSRVQVSAADESAQSLKMKQGESSAADYQASCKGVDYSKSGDL